MGDHFGLYGEMEALNLCHDRLEVDFAATNLHELFALPALPKHDWLNK